MTENEMLALAKAAGFDAACVVDTADIVFDPAFRPYCAANYCGQYGANYTCPPDCGEPEAMKQRITAHKKALVLQTLWEIPDWHDTARIKNSKSSHNAGELKVMKILREAGILGFIVGSSNCSLCSPCGAQTGKPCPHPDERWSCMSAYCIYVKALAERCGMMYDNGPGKVAFFGMYVFD
ncbi:MAG: DUF2284 domain-containing protein [Oscillospiraceae bacterium]|nr:DUF2284 domain-containing protein [Oscillospiraceae bacterium]